MRPLIITVTGKSGSGKTTLIEKIITHYKASGKKISVIKSMRHEFHTDPEGKDTFRYRESGASASIITNGKKYALVSDIDDGSDPLILAKKHFSSSDIIIIEGFKEGDIKKIEVIGNSDEPPLFLNDKNIKMIVTDKTYSTDLPAYKRDDIRSIISEIEKIF